MADPYANQYNAPGHRQYPPSPFGPQQGYDQSYFASQTPMQQQPMAAGQPVPLQEQPYAAPAAAHAPGNNPNAYNDPQAVSLNDYVQAEREERIYKNNNQYYQDAGYGGYTDHDYQHGNQQAASYHTQYYDDPRDASNIPMVDQSKQYSGRPRPAGPTLAPDDEADAYKPKTYQRHEDDGGCNCCCYNPAMTCCSCYCMILSLAFLAAGIALIVAASVIQGKCEEKCGQIPDQLDDTASACGTICEKVVHDGMFYSGIGITALSGLVIVWRLMSWICAGCSKN
ncbi:hypothetical protein BJV82DRAFT_621091 [Fennellomyces sp. T-0311]|nr:hypothetical protein BJV82DRAFT_621091 [Fennellomyces sp. T-0311]